MTKIKRLRSLRAHLVAATALLGAMACAAPAARPEAPRALARAQPPESPPGAAFRYNETPTQYVDVAGTRIAYRTLGTDAGEPPLVLLQHFTGTMDDWDPKVVEGLARHRRVYAFDNPGLGASEGVTPDSIEGLAQVALGLVDALNLGTVDLLGFSLGGAVAQQVLFDRPAGVRKAVLAGTAPKGAFGGEKLPAVLADAFKRAAQERSHPKAFLFFTDTPAGRLAASEFIGRINKHTVDPDPPATEATTRAQLNAVTKWSAAPRDPAALAAITQPVLVVNGGHDAMVPTAGSHELYQHIPRAQLILYPDSGHGALFQYHDAFVNEVDLFLPEQAVSARLTLSATLVALALGSTGCLTKLLVDGQIDGTRRGADAADTIGDYELARSGTEAGLVQFEGLHRIAPKNEDALFLLTKTWAAYGYAFIDDERELAQDAGATELAAYHQSRALLAYNRAIAYGTQLLSRRAGGLEAARKTETALKAWLQKLDHRGKDAPSLLWTGSAYLLRADLMKAQGDPVGIGALGEIYIGVAMIERSIELDPSYAHASGLIALATYYASPTILPQQFEQSRQLFETAIDRTERKNLTALLSYGRAYGCATGDRALYRRLLEEVRAAADPDPAQRLSNTIARRRAERYLLPIHQQECFTTTRPREDAP